MSTLEQLKPFGLKELPDLSRLVESPVCGKMLLQKQSVKRSLPLYDNSTSSAYTASGTVTWSHTTTTLPNVVGIVHVSTRSTGTIGTVTWGGVTMQPITGTGTGAATQPGTFATTATYVNRLFLIINPPTGSQSISLTGTSLVNSRCTAATYSGAAGLGVGFNFQTATTGTAMQVGVYATYGDIVVFFGGNAASASTSWSGIGIGTTRINTGASGGASIPTMILGDQVVTLYDQAIITGQATMAGTTPGASLYGLTIVGVGMEVCWTAISNTGNTVGAGPTTFTCNAPNSDANTVAIVGVTLSTGTNATPGFTVTYGGIAMTQVAIQQTGATTSRGCAAVYRLFNPPTGAQTVSVTATGVTATKITGEATIYRNVDPLAGISGSGTTTLTSPTFSSLSQKDSIITVHISGTTAALTIPTNAVYSNAQTVNSVTGVGDAWIMMHGPYSSIQCAGTATSPGTVGVWLQGQYITARPPDPLTQTVVDAFTAANNTVWTDAAITYTGGAARLTAASNSEKISKGSFDFRESYLDFQIGTATVSSSAHGFGMMPSYGGPGFGLTGYVLGYQVGATNQITPIYSLNSAGTGGGSSTAITHVSGYRYRIRETAGTVYWDVSTNNGGSWSNVWSNTWAAMGLNSYDFAHGWIDMWTWAIAGSGTLDVMGLNV